MEYIEAIQIKLLEKTTMSELKTKTKQRKQKTPNKHSIGGKMISICQV